MCVSASRRDEGENHNQPAVFHMAASRFDVSDSAIQFVEGFFFCENDKQTPFHFHIKINHTEIRVSSLTRNFHVSSVMDEILQLSSSLSIVVVFAHIGLGLGLVCTWWTQVAQIAKKTSLAQVKNKQAIYLSITLSAFYWAINFPHLRWHYIDSLVVLHFCWQIETWQYAFHKRLW